MSTTTPTDLNRYPNNPEHTVTGGREPRPNRQYDTDDPQDHQPSPTFWTFTYSPRPLTLLPPRVYIPRHVSLVPVKPPPPRQLSDPEAFRGNNAPVWMEYPPGSGFYSCVDRQTGRPALFAFHMLISSKLSENWGIPKFLKSSKGISGRKFFCVGENPGGVFSSYWDRCMNQLEALMRDFERKFPEVVAGVNENPGSFMKRGEKGTTIKIQQPLAQPDAWMYGLDDDPYYADFLRYANIPEEHKKIVLPIHVKDKRTGQLTSTTAVFHVNPAPYFDQQGIVVKLTDCPHKFADQLVEVEISLHHVYLSKMTRGGKPIPRCFIARPHAIALVDPNCLPPDQRVEQASTSASVQVKREVKEEVKEELTEPSMSTMEDQRIQQEPVQPPSTEVKKEEFDDEQVLHSNRVVERQQLVKQEVKEEYEEASTLNGKRRAVNQGARTSQMVKKEEEEYQDLCSKRMKN